MKEACAPDLTAMSLTFRPLFDAACVLRDGGPQECIDFISDIVTEVPCCRVLWCQTAVPSSQKCPAHILVPSSTSDADLLVCASCSAKP